jgi:MGT family glycosyltransferase
LSPPLTIALFPEAALGAALNCVAIAQELRALGHRPVFVCDAGFAGVFKGYGFDEETVPMTPIRGDREIADFWTKFIEEHRPHFRLSALQQIEAYQKPAWSAIVESAIHAEKRLRRVFQKLQPDAICLDNVIFFPAIARAKCPWVRIVSCAETEIPDPWVPPYTSGCPTGEEACAKAFLSEYHLRLRPLHDRYNAFLKSCGQQEMPDGLFLRPSPWLNLMLTANELRYRRKNRLDPRRFLYIGGALREEEAFALPRFPGHEKKPLLYVGFGSLGAADVELFRRMIALLANSAYRVLMSVGPYKDAYESVPDNIHLDYWYPQPSVIPQVDLFIHHGGNNSVNEALTFGKPSLVLPYCWDGHDNAQRLDELGLGKRLDRYSWRDLEFMDAIRHLLTDAPTQERLKAIGGTLRRRRSRRQAALAIVKVAERHRAGAT